MIVSCCVKIMKLRFVLVLVFLQIMFLRNHGLVVLGSSVEEAFVRIYHVILACEAQVRMMSAGLDNLTIISDAVLQSSFVMFFRRHFIPTITIEFLMTILYLFSNSKSVLNKLNFRLFLSTWRTNLWLFLYSSNVCYWWDEDFQWAEFWKIFLKEVVRFCHCLSIYYLFIVDGK